MITQNKYLIGAAVLVAFGSAVWGYGNWRYYLGKSDSKAEQHLAELEQFKVEVGKLQTVSTAIYKASSHLQATLPTIVKDYQNETILNPLPADCIMSDGRVRSINDIISEAAAARKSSGSLPANVSAKK